MHRFALTRNHLIHALLLCVAWGVSFLLIITLSPVQARMTIALDADAKHTVDNSIVGITPDGQELVVFTRHGDRPDRTMGIPTDWGEVNSGPLHLWNLQTGERRTVCLPFQDCNGPIDPKSPRHLRVDPKVWTAELVNPAPMRGRWLQCHFEPWKQLKDNQTRLANLLVQLDSGGYHFAADTEETTSSLELSRTGRWFVDVSTRRKFSKDSPRNRLRVRVTDTGQELFAFEIPRYFSEWVFSPDDDLFAHSTRWISDGDSDDAGRLRVWQLDPFKLLYQIENSDSAPVFSEDGRQLAIVLDEPTQSRILVMEARSGRRLVEHILHPKPLPAYQFHRLHFSADGRWLYYSRSEKNPPVDNHNISTGFAIDLQANTRTELSETRYNVRWHAYDRHASLPSIGINDDGDVIELPTGRVLRKLAENEDSEYISGDGRILLLRQSDPGGTPLMRALDYLESVNVPAPTALRDWASRPPDEWIFLDLATQRVLGRMPAQVYLKHWLSPDERTFVTQPMDGSLVAHIWDFPPRKPWRSAALWALIGPTLVLLWCWMRSRSLANRSATHQTAPMNS